MSISRTMVTTCENAQCLLMLLDRTVISRFAIKITHVCICMALTLTYAIPRPLFFHEALENKSVQLGQNIYSYISTFYPSLIKKGIVDEDEASMKQLDGIMFGHSFGFLKMY